MDDRIWFEEDLNRPEDRPGPPDEPDERDK